MQSYLELYARTFELYRYIRFGTAVTRLYNANTGSGRRWTVHSRSVSAGAADEDGGKDGEVVEDFDYVCVANGHYTDAWTPEVRGLR
jgi:cation diffusion facilitator CzcD-associated flavoprotein CzcO